MNSNDHYTHHPSKAWRAGLRLSSSWNEVTCPVCLCGAPRKKRAL